MDTQCEQSFVGHSSSLKPPPTPTQVTLNKSSWMFERHCIYRGAVLHLVWWYKFSSVLYVSLSLDTAAWSVHLLPDCDVHQPSSSILFYSYFFALVQPYSHYKHHWFLGGVLLCLRGQGFKKFRKLNFFFFFLQQMAILQISSKQLFIKPTCWTRVFDVLVLLLVTRAPLMLISATWPAWFFAVADALLHFAMSRPLEMPPWRPSPWQPLCLWHQYHHSTANGRGRERMRVLTLWNPVVQFRCNVYNFSDCACQDERDDFWFSKQVKQSYMLLHECFSSQPLFFYCFCTLVFHRLDSLSWQEIMSTMCLMTTNPFAQVPPYDMNVLWPVRSKKWWLCCNLKQHLQKWSRLAWLGCISVSFLYQVVLAKVTLKSTHAGTVMSTMFFWLIF